MKNRSNTQKVLTFNSSQIYDFVIKDEQNNIVSKWSEGKIFNQVIKKVKLNSGKSISYKAIIRTSNLIPGVYYLYGVIKSQNQLTTKPIKINIKN